MPRLFCVNRGNAHRNFLQHIKQNFYRIERREHCHIVFNRAAPDFIAVRFLRSNVDITRADDVIDMPLTNGIQNLRAAGAELFLNARFDSIAAKKVCGASVASILKPSW